MEGKLVLADGSEFYGELINADAGFGEVVFTTGMTGYQEVLTDPSYCGQIVVMTYPLIGNYGVTADFDQSRKPFVRGFIIDQLCEYPSNCRNEKTLTEYLAEHKIPCLHGVDTRAVTRKIRSYGTMRGVITGRETTFDAIQPFFANEAKKLVDEVTTEAVYHIPANGPHVVVMDFGIKKNILRSLHQAGCNLTVVPAGMNASNILTLNPDAVFLSNGPGDPKDVPYAIETIRQLLGKKPIFGICLGHQLLALALGADTYKLKFGHRGSNHPVKNLASGRVHITAQNHGYAVCEKSLAELDVDVTHRAVNDGTVEGVRHRTLSAFSVQFHPEASPGPDDSVYLFDQFLKMIAN